MSQLPSERHKLTVPTERRNTTVPKLASSYGISAKKILIWIETGELRAVNHATNPIGRPRWSVDWADWEAFERKREAQPPAAAKREAMPAMPRLRRKTPSLREYV